MKSMIRWQLEKSKSVLSSFKILADLSTRESKATFFIFSDILTLFGVSHFRCFYSVF